MNDDGVDLSVLDETFDDIGAEVIRARQKFPGNRHLLAALVEEVGELSQAYLQRQGSQRIREEAMQVACVAIRIMEEGDSAFAVLDDAIRRKDKQIVAAEAALAEAKEAVAALSDLHRKHAAFAWTNQTDLRARVAELEGELAAAKTDKALLEVSNGSLRSMVDAPLPKSEFERIVTAPSDADRKALVEVMRSLGMVSAYTRGVDCIGPKDAAAIFEAIADRARAAGT
jgi:hypothetical protein